MAFKTSKILEGFHFIERGYLSANHFVFTSSSGGAELVDSGYLGGLDDTLAAIAEVGVDLRSVKRIVSTHCHCDHIGGNSHIQWFSGCTVAMHPEGKRIIDEWDSIAGWWGYYDQQAAPFTCDQVLEEGMELSLGGYRFQVLFLPGHSHDLIALYDRANKILLSSDALWEADMAVINEEVEGEDAVERFLASVDKMKGLDVELVLPGHGRPFTDFDKALMRTEHRLKRFREDPEKIGLDVLKKIMVYTLMMCGPLGRGVLFNQLCRTAWFPRTVERYFGQGVEELMYNRILNSLERRGAVEIRDGLIRSLVKK